MTDEVKDWHEGHLNGYHARSVADYIWTDAWRDPDADTKPDMSILRRNQLPAPRFPVEILGPAAEWVKTTAESKAAPVDYVALSVFVASAGTIGSKRRVSPWPGWDEPSIIWGANVGPPSVSKSPSTDPCRDALRAVERGLNVDWDRRVAKFEADKNAADVRRTQWEQDIAVAVKSGGPVPDLPADANEPER